MPQHASGAAAQAESQAMPMPSIGRIVEYRLHTGAIRPAIIVDVQSPTTVHLRVFTAGTEDATDFGGQHGIELVRGCIRGEVPGSWSWPQYEPKPSGG
jgi:hypothetical protein